ncbi:MAG: hypothetical protein DRJ38_04370 [Thermoprotei archaeon]|nr:MAG: hypothetical protein DRJ38_04370 [Thermoprotei archaeon]
MKEKKISLIHLTPVFLSSIISSIMAWILERSNILAEVETPFSRSPTVEATFYNLIVFMSLIGFGSILLYILVKLRKIGILKLLFLSSLALSLLGIIEIYTLAFSTFLNFKLLPLEDFSILLASIVSLITVYIIATIENEYIIALLMLFYGSSAGSLFGVLLPMWTIILVAITLSLYDLYSVFKGPLKHLIELEKSRTSSNRQDTTLRRDSIFRGAVVPFKGLYLGIGDIIFYSMIVSAIFLKPQPSLLRLIAAVFALSIGAYTTFKLVEKRGALPALPLPLLLAILTYAISLFFKL